MSSILLSRPLVAQDENTIYVFGKQRERTQKEGNGKSVEITPSDTSRFDSDTHLKLESSLAPNKTGRILPSGFVVPRIRGQDAKITEVYFDDIILQDPYTGLPLVDDLDLRAFGKMSFFQGLSPYDLPSTNPVGAMRYSLAEFDKNSFATGVEVGRPFGTLGWGKAQASVKREESQIKGQVYFREHVTNGRYAHYDDNATPYNDSDDTISWRSNNEQRSKQAVPYLNYRFGNNELSYLGWWHEAKRGIPSYSSKTPSHAKELVFGNLNIFKWTYTRDTTSTMLPKQISININSNDEVRKLKDSEQVVLNTAKSQALKVKSERVGLSLKWRPNIVTPFIKSDFSLVEVKNSFDGNNAATLKRNTASHYAGVDLEIPADINLEAKIMQRDFADHFNVDATSSTEEKTHSAKGHGGSLMWSPSFMHLYAQYGREERSPSLIEEFGNGSTLQGNSELEPEIIRHYEFGASTNQFAGNLIGGLTYFSDKTEEKIAFVPSLLNTSKAINIQKTKITGLEALAEATIAKTTLQVSASRIFPYDESSSEEHKIIPGVPQKILVTQLTQNFWSNAIRWTSRYQSEVYRDIRNNIQIPAVWIHDASFDSNHQFGSMLWQLGISLYNVTDVKSAPIRAAGENGKTSYSEVSGQPLPGRHWKLAIATKL